MSSTPTVKELTSLKEVQEHILAGWKLLSYRVAFLLEAPDSTPGSSPAIGEVKVDLFGFATETYEKVCKGKGERPGCGQPIIMAKVDGKWGAYNKDGKPHRCG